MFNQLLRYDSHHKKYLRSHQHEAAVSITQSKSKTIITRSMLTISLIVFTDKFQGHVHTFYSKWYFITF